jgi:predicted esterase
MMASHEDQPLLRSGPELADAGALLILLHGRGSSAADILTLEPHLRRDGLALAAPQAEGQSWFPYSFLVPVEQNKPGVPSAMTVINSLVQEAELLGVPRERVMILGFSQGACLALEFAVRHPARYGGFYGLSGGLMGPPGTTWQSDGSLAGTPVFLGSSDVDSSIPRSRVEETAEVFTRLGASVTLTLYPGMAHTITAAEIRQVNAMVAEAMQAGSREDQSAELSVSLDADPEAPSV